jgi:RNA polymerase sigma factor (sigma-70 family)
MSTGPSDGGTVERARAGDKGAFGELLTRHRPLAYHLAWRLLDDAAEAEDVTQEACLQAFLGLSGLRDPERFGAWLAGIALNLARMRLRARRDMVSLEDWDGGRVPPDFRWAETHPSPEAVAELHELHRCVLRALEALPAEQRAVVRLHYLDGLTLAEIGVLAGAPLGTVKARLHRAREKLRAQLLQELERPEPVRRPGLLRKEKAMWIEVEVDKVVMRTPKRKGDEAGALEVRVPLPPPSLAGVKYFWVQGGEQSASAVQLPTPHPLFHRVVLLKEKGGERVLPIWIGPHEGDMIALQLAGQAAPRPQTYDLAARLLEAAQAHVVRVEINRLHEEVFYAQVHLRAGAETRMVDARPSDAINLALRTKAPIWVAAEVMDSQAVAEARVFETLNQHAEEAELPADLLLEWQPVPPPELASPKQK